MNKFFIGVAGHKPYKMPQYDIYTPIQVGASGRPTIDGFLRDDVGDNISDLNANFSELTGLYYIWKNVNSEYKGLVHYRRYLGNKNYKLIKPVEEKFDSIIKYNDLKLLFDNNDVILPKKRNYYVETNYSHYIHAHSPEALRYVKNIISESCPEYLNSYNKVMDSRSAHMFNMFIMKSNLFDEYCKWLFSILFKLREKIDISRYSGQEVRVFGYVSELLLDVWLNKNEISFAEVPVVYVEGQHLFRKGINLLKRKIFRHGNSHIKSSID